MSTPETSLPIADIGSAEDIYPVRLINTARSSRIIEWLNEWGEGISRKEKVIAAAGALSVALGGVVVGRGVANRHL